MKIITSTFALFFVFAWLFITAYPGEWDDIRMGMTRWDIYKFCGDPDSNSSRDMKGEFWRHETAWRKWELLVGYENETYVDSTRIRFFFGEKKDNMIYLKRDGSYRDGLLWDIGIVDYRPSYRDLRQQTQQ